MAHRLLARQGFGSVDPMKPGPRHLPFAAHRSGRRTALEAFSRTEKIIAFCRVLLATATLAIVVADPKQPALGPELAYLLLTAYVGYSATLFLLVRGELIRKELIGPYSTGADIVWVTLIAVFTEGGTSPYFLLQAFVVFSVSVRWGMPATMAVTAVLAALYPAALYLAGQWADVSDFASRRTLFRPVYLLVLGYLVGYLGEHERHSKRKLGFMLDLPAAFHHDRPPGRAILRLTRRALEHFKAERGLVVVRDPESGRFFTWEVTRRGGRTRLGLRITETDPLPQPFAATTEGFLANDLSPGNASALCYDVLSGTIQRKRIAADSPLLDRGITQAVIASPILIQRESRGHVVVVRESGGKFTRDDLEFLLLLVAQAAAGFENVRLQQKAEEVAVLEERARIARDLHDGFIQSLAGIDLRIEACKMLFQRDPGRVPRELEDLHQVVDRGYREVRHYMNVLRDARRDTDDLWTGLDRVTTEFATRERLRLHVEHPKSDPGLPPEGGYEVVQIVREALRNAVRHGQATQALVKVGCRPSHLYLVVRDNGRGFPERDGAVDADGFLAESATPWSIRERVAALGGALRVWTQPGRGSEISLTIPAGPRGARLGSDRRMLA